MSETRRCIGSERFGIEPHDAPIEDFPKQASQKDGLGRMCKVHWNQYTAGLARDAKARKAAESVTTAALTEETEASVTGLPVTEEAATLQATSKRSRRPKAPPPVAEGEEVAG